jgi:ketosteroid isomerase-like protein
MFQKTIICLALFCFCSFSTYAQKIDKDYHALANKFAELSLGGNYTSLVELFADGAIVDDLGTEYKGKNAIKEFYLKRGSMGKYTGMSITPDEIIMITDNEAIGRGAFSIDITLKENKQNVQVKGRFMNHVKRINGKWIIVRHMAVEAE